MKQRERFLILETERERDFQNLIVGTVLEGKIRNYSLVSSLVKGGLFNFPGETYAKGDFVLQRALDSTSGK